MDFRGEESPARVIERLRQQAFDYELDGRPVQPALEFIVTVAQESAGADGMYRYRMPSEVVEEWIDLAEQNGLLMILDVQVGRSTVQEEVEAIRPYLTRHHVHLALDPEFDMTPTTFPGRTIGSTSAEDVNWTIEYLAEIAETHGFENRILIVHQFTDAMVANREDIRENPWVDFVICMDGFGPPGLKIRQYDRYLADMPAQYASIKLFYRQDRPLMTPSDVLDLDPVPMLVIYQ